MSIPGVVRAPWSWSRSGWGAVLIAAVLGAGPVEGWGAEPGSGKKAEPGKAALGRELFLRKWVAKDPRSHGGDGLGPMYNETSCVACHSLGGPGGAGPVDKDVMLVLATSDPTVRAQTQAKGDLRHRRTTPGAAKSAGALRASSVGEESPLIQYHAGFRNGSTVVLHRYGTPDGYAERRAAIVRDLSPLEGLKNVWEDANLLSRNAAVRNVEIGGRACSCMYSRLTHLSPGFRRIESHQLSTTERNTPPLFGAGLIDAVPSPILMAAARRQDPKVRGRLNGLPGRASGRFGWKAQTASLREFVYAACANELGLEVPGHHQAAAPMGSVAAGGLDPRVGRSATLARRLRGQPPRADSGPRIGTGPRRGGRGTLVSSNRVCGLPCAVAGLAPRYLQRPAAPRHGPRALQRGLLLR